MIRAIAVMLAAVALGACAVSQLSEFKKLEAANDEASIESKTISAGCFVAQPSDECAQLTEIQGRACLTLAKQESAPNAACPPATATAQRRLQCAARDFQVAEQGATFSAADKADITQMRARALYCGATLKDRNDGLVDARQALAELDTLPPSPERDQLAAASLLYVANTDSLAPAERCSAAKSAAARAARGLAENPSTAEQAGLEDTRQHAASVGTHIGNCSVE